MKKDFFDYLFYLMKGHPNIFFISCGLGWPRTDELKEKYPTRFVQTESSEQTALDIAVGLAYSGKIPFVYTITPFLLRGYETIRTYINHEKLNVKMVGAGRDNDYSKHDGFSHEAGDIMDLLGMLQNIVQYYPETKEEMIKNISQMVKKKGPAFISIKK